MSSILAVLLVGAALGAVVQRTHFCTMGAISDLVLFGSTRRLRSWLLALAVAMAGTQALGLAGLVRVGVPPEGWLPSGWLGTGLGGLAFGFGMVLAGGCISRNLVRLGGGSLKALLVVLLAGLLAASVWQGQLWAVSHGLSLLSPGELPDPPASPSVSALLLAAVLAVGCLADAGFRRAPRDVAAGLLLGLLPPLTWLLVDPSADPTSGQGLSYAIPTGLALSALTDGAMAGFALALVLGTVGGAFAMALGTGQLRLETFTSSDDMVRHVGGGILMGLGGGLAAGCTVGHGLTGLAMLAPASFLAIAAMALGAAWALSWLQTGSPFPYRSRPNDA